MLASRNEAQAAASAPSAAVRIAPVAVPRRSPERDDPRFKKLQEQLDAQGKAIDDTRTGLASTQGDLVNTRTELSGSIAHTHDELVVLQKKGERNYAEFDFRNRKSSNARDRLKCG